MKRIDAVIPEKNLDAVNNAIHQVGATGVTVFNTTGRGKIPQKGEQMGYWMYYPNFGSNKLLMVLTADADADKVVQAIRDSADAGKIIVTNVETLVDIQNKTSGEQAL